MGYPNKSPFAALGLAALAIQCLLMAGSTIELVQARRVRGALSNPFGPVTPDMCKLILEGYPRMDLCCGKEVGKNCPPFPDEIMGPCCRIWGQSKIVDGGSKMQPMLQCVYMFYQLASHPELADSARVPTECCNYEPFHWGCARLGKARLQRVVRGQMLAASRRNRNNRYADWMQGGSPTCSRRQVQKCCGGGGGDDSGNTELVIRERNLLFCSLELFMNIIRFKLEVPDACCDVIIFKIFAKCRSSGTTPGPVPWPSPNPIPTNLPVVYK